MVAYAAASQVTPLREDGKRDTLAQGEETLPSLEEIADRIYRLESSGGKNDNCHKLNKHNGYGFGVYNNHVDCFDSDLDARKQVKQWFVEKLKKYSLEQSACGYNTGKFENGCLYYQNFASIN